MTVEYNGADKRKKRILAFSGISHAGFMLMTLLNTTNTAGTLLYYTSAYALAGSLPSV
jgi:NADH-quinone oxidoreductase subunit N